MAVRWQGAAVTTRIKRAAMQGIVGATEAVREEAISLILDTPKTGRIYRRRTVTHQASAPGEAPASDTGQLVNSIKTIYNKTELSGIVRASTKYAAFLEFGTVRMAERPFLRPALASQKNEVEAKVASAIRATLGI